jgi:hypothetical protein
MPQSLCPSCNAPYGPLYDQYEDLAHELLSAMAEGITLLRLANEIQSQRRKELPRGLTEWKLRANKDLHLGNDYREERDRTKTPHDDCDAFKITFRRVSALCRDLDFLLRLVRGIG